MIRLKTQQEIETLAEGGAMLCTILDELERMVAPGITGVQLDDYAQKRMKDFGVIPSFLGYKGKGHPPFPAAVCVSVNEGVVHGVPKDVPFREGDIVGIDTGLIYRGLYVDAARTVPVGNVSDTFQKMINVTREALAEGVRASREKNTTGHIGEAIQSYVERNGFSVVRQLVGHGVGYDVHEPPQVPNFGSAGEGETLLAGLVIAIEPMVTIGDPTVTTAGDGWSVVTKSGAPAAHFEHTVAITKQGPRVLTSLK